MHVPRSITARVFLLVTFAAGASCRTAVSPAPILQPGAPGGTTRTIDTVRATDLSGVHFTDADVRFMQGMIGHHAQAVEMVALIPDRTSRDDMRLLGLRIDVSQSDEIDMMEHWLQARGAAVPDAHAHMHDGGLMPGMLSADEMQHLVASHGVEFDRLFLEGMIKHHQGALTMVEQLFSSPGAAQESEMFAFASDVDADQRMEIGRMSALLQELQR